MSFAAPGQWTQLVEPVVGSDSMIVPVSVGVIWKFVVEESQPTY